MLARAHTHFRFTPGENSYFYVDGARVICSGSYTDTNDSAYMNSEAMVYSVLLELYTRLQEHLFANDIRICLPCLLILLILNCFI